MYRHLSNAYYAALPASAWPPLTPLVPFQKVSRAALASWPAPRRAAYALARAANARHLRLNGSQFGGLLVVASLLS